MENIDDAELYVEDSYNSGSVEQSKTHGDYFRDLSANYSSYQASGKWPARPEGLVIVEPMSDADLARA